MNINNQNLICKEQYYKLANELLEYASNYYRDDKENWMCITSFSPIALKTFHDYIPKEKRKNFDYILIAGYTGGWPKSWLAQSKGFVPKFDSDISSFIISTEWLDCVWFSAQGITDFNKIFNSINITRHKLHPDWNEVSFSYSTYQKKQDKMEKMMIKKPELKAKIRSFMLDLDYKIK